jgi:hypothetical protein
MKVVIPLLVLSNLAVASAAVARDAKEALRDHLVFCRDNDLPIVQAMPSRISAAATSTAATIASATWPMRRTPGRTPF